MPEEPTMKFRLLLALFLSAFSWSCDDSSNTTGGSDEWTWHPVLTGSAFNAIADDGVSFAVVGDEARAQTSVDGRSWSVRTPGSDYAWNDVAGTQEGWIYVGSSGHVGLFSDTANPAMVIPGTPDLLGIAASESILVVVGKDGFIASSPTWDDWTPRTSPAQATLEDVHYNGTVFVAVGHNGTIVVSHDGKSWSQVQSGTQQTLTGVTEGPFGTWLAVGPEGTVVRGLFPDASQWEGVIETLTLSLQDVVWTGTRFVSVGRGGYIGESSDNGQTWFKETSPTTQDLRRLVFSHGHLIAVGTGTTILVSEEPGSWQAVNPGAGFDPRDAIWSGSRFVVVGGSSVLISLDGSTWSETYKGTNILLEGVAQSPSTLVAVGRMEIEGPLLGAMVGSQDGIHWSPIAGALTDQLYVDIAWGDPGFLAVSQSLDGAMSTDGQSWARVAFPAEFHGIAWGNGTYVALGNSAIGLSENGIDWEFVPYPFATQGPSTRVYWLDGEFFLAGPGDRISTSPDGRNWDVHSTQSGMNIVAVTRRGVWTYATGGFGTILASSNLQTWSEQESGTTNELRHLVANDRIVLAVGDSGTFLTLD
jgi:hypothetical protein